jgi:hypothetical protein
VAIFEYGFGMALSIAFVVAIGGGWVRDHRKGIWSPRMALGAAAVAIVLGLAIGWGLQQYLDFVAITATHRYSSD